jgi:hypothetical protein
MIGHQGPHQSLTVDPIGLCPPVPSRCHDRSRIDHMALNALFVQNPMDPEAIQTRLLDDDDRKILSRSPPCSLLESCKPTQKTGNVPTPHCMF